MRALIILMSLMGIAIVVALGFVVYGIQRNIGEGGDGADLGLHNLGLPDVCEIAEAQVEDDRILIRTTGIAERGCQQVFILDANSGARYGVACTLILNGEVAALRVRPREVKRQKPW